ncbi:threonine-phosphate decarboxylase [Virgibacillus phasianinus]|uniref:threonine-phosphate decarboxylase n=1 Tax=Virgibacillus phasianinus TaxID=2017483 RepID=A0A220U1E0_9BACI|nr:threonine-phosphate decarboxylase CobD [Virgibacillus phasianinus]ASK61855.1 threonine-phosphate decarboxylase [Virgibacillus phasianinus]
MNWPIHGSNPQYIYNHLQLPMPKNIIDFSVNVNPFGPPALLKEKWIRWFAAVSDYPDPNNSELIEVISEKEKLPRSSILPGNGGAELIGLLAKMFSGKRVLLIQPTFSEYERMCTANGCQISNLILKENDWEIPVDDLSSKLARADVLFLCHPNNPTGIIYSEQLLLQIVNACQQQDCFLVIDEAFYDFTDESNTIASYLKDYNMLIIIRSMTKMYAIPGLRLGYILAAPSIIKELHQNQAHWSVNALALLAGKECLLADNYINKTKTFVSIERKRMVHALQQAGYLVSASRVNFYLVRDPELGDQLPLFMFLVKKGIVARHTANYQGLNGRWLRFSIKQTHENDILLKELLAWKKKS